MVKTDKDKDKNKDTTTPLELETSWLDSYKPGSSINILTGELMDTAVEYTNESGETPSLTTKSELHIINSQDDFDQMLEISGSGSYSINGIKLSASADYLHEVKVSELSKSLLMSYEVKYDGYDTVTGVKFSKEALDFLKEKPDDFRNIYGDYYIAGAKRMASFYALYTLQARSKKTMDQFMATMEASAPNLFDVEASTKFRNEASASQIDINLTIYIRGTKSAIPISANPDAEDVAVALKKFQDEIYPVPFMAQLIHYSQLDTTITNTYDLDSETFGTLRDLYQLYWSVKTLYESLNEYYKGTFEREFNEFTNDIESHKDEFVKKDLTKINESITRANNLYDKYTIVSQRWAVYNRIAALPKPVVNQEYSTDILEFGAFNTSDYASTSGDKGTASKSVYIHRSKGHHRSADHIIPPLPADSLVIGFQIDNKGHLGDWKVTAGGLLETYIEFYAGSTRSHTLDVIFTVYYVKKDDYQFGDTVNKEALGLNLMERNHSALPTALHSQLFSDSNIVDERERYLIGPQRPLRVTGYTYKTYVYIQNDQGSVQPIRWIIYDTQNPNTTYGAGTSYYGNFASIPIPANAQFTILNLSSAGILRVTIGVRDM